jgi:hypothetical protein
MSKTQFVSVAGQNLLVVVAKRDRAVAAPASTAIVRTDCQIALGVKQAREGVCIGLAQPGGRAQTGKDRGLTAGAS